VAAARSDAKRHEGDRAEATHPHRSTEESEMPAMEGDRAPGFQLQSKPGEIVDSAEMFGREKVVLLFFPLAFSSVCTTEMRTVSADWDAWSELGARVYGISVDSPFVTERFREALGIPFPILSDFNRTVATAYDVLHEELMGLRGVTKRAAIVVDGGGRISYRWVADNPGIEPDYEAVKRAVRSAPAA